MTREPASRRIASGSRRFVVVVGLAALLTAIGALASGPLSPPSGSREQVAPASAPRAEPTVDDLTRVVQRAQERLAGRPDDWQTWAQLGMAYVQLGRVTADLSWYPRADQALHRSLAIRPEADNVAALIGLGALAAGRHDFAAALLLGQQAVAVDGFSAAAYGVVADALIELGRYDEAFSAIQQMVDLRPDTGSYARASYAFELRGDTSQAFALMERALAVAPSAADVGFTRYHLAELAFGAGDLARADADIAGGLLVAPGYRPLVVARAKVIAARGDLVGAIAELRPVVAAMPVPAYAAMLGELLEATDDQAGAGAQYDLVRAVARLQAEQGINVDLDLVLFHADHGDPAVALASAQAGYASRPTIAAEDALAWALHVNGDDVPALAHSNQALRLATRDAQLYYHRGMIEFSLGRTDAARRDLAQALQINPYFSVRHASVARDTLATIGGP